MPIPIPDLPFHSHSIFPPCMPGKRSVAGGMEKQPVECFCKRSTVEKGSCAGVLFYSLYQTKKQLLQYADSLYTGFYEKAALRLLKGETNILEKASAATQLGQIQTQLQQLQEDSAILQLQFQLLLNTTNPWLPKRKITRCN